MQLHKCATRASNTPTFIVVPLISYFELMPNNGTICEDEARLGRKITHMSPSPRCKPLNRMNYGVECTRKLTSIVRKETNVANIDSSKSIYVNPSHWSLGMELLVYNL
jgi:hypothetical protein